MTEVTLQNIRTKCWPKPVPDRSFDWEAWIEGNEEFGTGYGKTESDAIAELIIMATESQVFKGQWLMPMYTELPQVDIDDAVCAQQALNDVLMFGGNR